MLYDIAVVGGGAAGLFAAITAKKLNNKLNIAVFEALDRVGKKLITTGNGQCNITNRYAEPRFYHSETPELLRYPLEAFTVNDTVKAFREIGVEIVFEADGRAYPASYQAGAVVDALRFTCEELGVEVICNAKVSSFSKKEYFHLKTEQGDFSAKKVILACGLLSGGAKLGSFGDTLRLLKESGYKAAKTTPAIVQLKTDTAVTRSLKGIKFSGEATLLENGKKVSKSSGEILFTDYGLSGPAILAVSREAARRSGKIEVALDILPDFEEEELSELLYSRRESLSARCSENFLTGLINKRLGQALLKGAGIPLNIAVSDITDKQLSDLCRLIKGFTFAVTGNTGFNNSQVTAGGISLREIDIKTFEAGRQSGLYIIGELLDADGDCGGFNLQWAWSSAALAARSAVRL